MSVEFEDFSIQVKDAIEDAALRLLEEAASEIEAQTVRNIDKAKAVKTGQLKGSWKHIVDESTFTATIGSPLQNAIWTEFGTGEYAVNGDGRKGGWRYQDDNGDWHFTKGKKPVRMFQRGFETSKPKIIKRAKAIFGELG